MTKKAQVAPEHGFGVVHRRICRDIIFLIIFAAYWIGMFIVCTTAIKNGDPSRLM